MEEKTEKLVSNLVEQIYYISQDFSREPNEHFLKAMLTIKVYMFLREYDEMRNEDQK